MYCNQCGRQIEPESQFCAGCGKAAQEQPVNTTTYYGSAGQPRQGDNSINTYFDNAPKKGEGNAFWWGVLSFFLSPISFVFYFVWREQYPKRAKVMLWCAIAGIVIYYLSLPYMEELSFKLVSNLYFSFR